MTRRALDVNAASMVGLKAELYRKREEARQSVGGPRPKPAKKTPIWARKNRGVADRAAKDRPEPADTADDVLLRSRQALEAKARLYDELSHSKHPLRAPDDESGFLVDFERKAEVDEDDAYDDADEDWVEYEDAFGRLRRCLREELPHHLARNDELRERLATKEEEKEKKEKDEEDEDEEEEEVRRHVEEEVPSKLELHYADVQQAEIRQHGVGFYALSAEASERQQQMGELKKLREETAKSRERAARVREKRKAALEERLARVKQRRGASEQKEEKEEEKDEVQKEEMQEDAIAVKLAELREQAELLKPRAATTRREWDRGKAMMSAEKYLEQRRSERYDHFAPPSNYFK